MEVSIRSCNSCIVKWQYTASSAIMPEALLSSRVPSVLFLFIAKHHMGNCHETAFCRISRDCQQISKLAKFPYRHICYILTTTHKLRRTPTYKAETVTLFSFSISFILINSVV